MQVLIRSVKKSMETTSRSCLLVHLLRGREFGFSNALASDTSKYCASLTRQHENKLFRCSLHDRYYYRTFIDISHFNGNCDHETISTLYTCNHVIRGKLSDNHSKTSPVELRYDNLLRTNNWCKKIFSLDMWRGLQNRGDYIIKRRPENATASVDQWTFENSQKQNIYTRKRWNTTFRFNRMKRAKNCKYL